MKWLLSTLHHHLLPLPLPSPQAHTFTCLKSFACSHDWNTLSFHPHLDNLYVFSRSLSGTFFGYLLLCHYSKYIKWTSCTFPSEHLSWFYYTFSWERINVRAVSSLQTIRLSLLYPQCYTGAQQILVGWKAGSTVVLMCLRPYEAILIFT